MPIFLFFLLSGQVILYEDKVIYKVKNEVIFESDLANIVLKYKVFQCLKPNSTLFRGSLKNSFLKDINRDRSKKLNKIEVLDLLKIEKLLLYSESQELSVELKGFKNNKNCGEPLSDVELKRFLSFDLLLESRFSRNGQLLEDSVQSLIETIDYQYPHEFYL